MTRPLISIDGVSLGNHALRVRDEETPHRARKPAGAVQVQLFGAIGDRAVPHYIGSYSRHRISICFSPADNGQTITYTARWINRRGETGPWSRPLSVPIVAVAPLAEARAAA